MDLSGIIFAALAIGWAVYLIPKALQHSDEAAVPRSVESFSQRMRVIGGTRTTASTVPIADSEPTAAPMAPVDPAQARAAARLAAARRRRVLGILLALTAVVGGAAALSYLPTWSPAVPGAMIVAFLVIARITVRRERAARLVQTGAPADPAPVVTAPVAESGQAEGSVDTEDTVGVDRQSLDAALATPMADEGSLWDPLPVTLPTYVTKPTARRTVRTIELTRTRVTSSGHDAADSQLVRDSEAEKAKASSHNTANGRGGDEGEQRKVAGA